jgi:hypothetical protein
VISQAEIVAAHEAKSFDYRVRPRGFLNAPVIVVEYFVSVAQVQADEQASPHLGYCLLRQACTTDCPVENSLSVLGVPLDTK